MDKKRISVIIEVVVFILILGGITFFYYFSGNNNDKEDTKSVGIIEVDDENFEAEVLNSDKPVILEFSSNMCPPCLTMVPTLISIAKNNPDVKVVTLNTSEDNAKKTAEKYEIEATPTIMILKDGAVVKTFIGATSEDTIMAEIK